MVNRIVSMHGVRLLLKKAKERHYNGEQSPIIIPRTLEEYRSVEKALIDNNVYWNGGESVYPGRDASLVAHFPVGINIEKRSHFDSSNITRDRCRFDIALTYKHAVNTLIGSAADMSDLVFMSSRVRYINNFEEE